MTDWNGRGEWNEYRRLILQQLADLTQEVHSLRDQIAGLNGRVTALRTQMAFIGAAAAAIVSLGIAWWRDAFP